jgi:HSP20 family protein
MQLVRWEPFGLLREFERLLEPTTEDRTWVPRIDAFDRDGALVMRAEVAGIAADDIDVSVEDGKLTLSGSRSFRSETTDEEPTAPGYHRKEIFEGSFKRTVFLPDTADIDNISASSKDGILEVTVPMLAEALPKKVTVNVEA